jgi:hypothetical protein
MKQGQWLIAFAVGALLSACGQAATTIPTVTLDPTRPGPVMPTASPPEGSPTPTARASLEATDPTTVNLGEDGPMFVEFFAFW